eukprot:3280199-Amphidinium_carterae.1
MESRLLQSAVRTISDQCPIMFLRRRYEASHRKFVFCWVPGVGWSTTSINKKFNLEYNWLRSFWRCHAMTLEHRRKAQQLHHDSSFCYAYRR